MADSPLQKIPDGVLGALDLKTLGQNPQLFSEVLTPILDVYDQYLANETLTGTANGTIPIASSGITATHIVPQGESWRVLAIGGIATLAAADAAFSATFAWSVLPRASTTSAPMLNAPVIAPLVAGSISRSWGTLLSRPLYLPSGFRLQMLTGLSAVATVAVATTNRILYQRITT